jgi:hypothetical protein
MKINITLDSWKLLALALGASLIFTQVYDVNLGKAVRTSLGELANAKIEEIVLPSKGVTLPISWDGLGDKMIEAGVIDSEKFEELYVQRGKFDEARELLHASQIDINQQNSDIVLNLLWAFGLGNKNVILEEGPMVDEQYGGDAGRFASTGGWRLARGAAMDHYSKYEFVVLTPERQVRVENVSKNIYRPCCGNSTFFPDCNHGMAMLGLLELLAAQDLSEEEMYDVALKVNSYWFPDTYIAIAHYLKKKGIEWKDVEAKEVLGDEFSSASGYRGVLAEINPPTSTQSQGGGCGV